MAFKPQLYSFYETLDRNHDFFRLCKLLPAEADAPIHCELVTDRISVQKGNYSALSYTWGESSGQRWIRMNGKPYHVQPNLHQALRAVRRPHTELLLWVDAICINQSETAERNHQVSLMGEIYRNANTVLAWLGPETDESDLFFDYLGRSDALPETEEDSAKHVLDSLSRQPYWCRAWIKQELILAKDIIVYCGSKHSNATSFLWLAGWVTYKKYNQNDSNYIMDIFIHRAEREQEGKKATLAQLLERYSDTQCGDVRDRVFALLSLASDCENSQAKLVDYSLSRPALFFALLACLQPSDVIQFATRLQDVLAVRRVRLVEHWDTVTEDANLKGSSDMEEIGFKYIRMVKKYSISPSIPLSAERSLQLQLEAQNSGFPLQSDTPRFIAESYIAASDLSDYIGMDKIFPIEGTSICFRVRPTLFGQRFVAIGKATGGQEAGWSAYSPNCSLEQQQRWEYISRPILGILRGEGQRWEDLVRIRDVVWADRIYEDRTEVVDADYLCFMLAELAEVQRTESFQNVCLVDCRCIIALLYGGKLLRPIQLEM